MLVQFHVDLPAPEGNSLRFEPEALFKRIVSLQLDRPSRTQHTLPWQSNRTS